jgi:putative ABC transport system substrate-binding protein
MRRREFITLIGGSAALLPLAAFAQRIPLFGILMNINETDAEAQPRLKELFEGLKASGWVDGRNLRAEIRWSNGNPQLVQTLAQELASLRPYVLLAQGTLSLKVLAEHTPSIPIVFANVSDPVGDGFVVSLAHPGGNITGFAQYEYTIGGK